MPQLMQRFDCPVTSQIRGVNQICEVGILVVIIILQLVQQTPLQFNSDLLQGDDCNMVSIFKCLPEALHTSLLLFFDLVWCLGDCFLEIVKQARRRWCLALSSLLLDLRNDNLAVSEGLRNGFKAYLHSPRACQYV